MTGPLARAQTGETSGDEPYVEISYLTRNRTLTMIVQHGSWPLSRIDDEPAHTPRERRVAIDGQCRSRAIVTPTIALPSVSSRTKAGVFLGNSS